MRMIPDENGRKIRYDAFHDAWEAAMAKAVKSDGIEPFRPLNIYDGSVSEVGPTK